MQACLFLNAGGRIRLSEEQDPLSVEGRLPLFWENGNILSRFMSNTYDYFFGGLKLAEGGLSQQENRGSSGSLPELIEDEPQAVI